MVACIEFGDTAAAAARLSIGPQSDKNKLINQQAIAFSGEFDQRSILLAFLSYVLTAVEFKDILCEDNASDEMDERTFR